LIWLKESRRDWAHASPRSAGVRRDRRGVAGYAQSAAGRGVMMKHILLTTCMLGALAVAGSAAAQTTGDAPVGKAAGTWMVRGRIIDVDPENNGSSTSVGGHVSATNSATVEADFSYFFTDHIAAELIAATTKHDITAKGTSVGDVKVGSTWVLPPTLLLQYHFMPKERFSPYVGVGLNATFFYSNSPARPIVTGMKLDNNIGEALQIGADYNISGHWFLNADIKQIFLPTKAKLTTVLGPVSAKTSLDPLVVGVGAGYRF
jgi:outer membrane protein